MDASFAGSNWQMLFMPQSSSSTSENVSSTCTWSWVKLNSCKRLFTVGAEKGSEPNTRLWLALKTLCAPPLLLPTWRWGGWWQRKHLQNASSGKEQSVQQSMQCAVLSVGIKRDEIIRLYSLFAYICTQWLWRDETKLLRRLLTVGTRAGGRFHCASFNILWILNHMLPMKDVKKQEIN